MDHLWDIQYIYVMCATYTYHVDEAQIEKVFAKYLMDESAPFEKIKDDVFPFTYAPVLVAKGKFPMLTAKRYSLTPSWASTEKVKWATYNARMNRPKAKGGGLEYIYEVASWKDSFAKYHCLVPMTRFKESCHEGKAAGHMVKFIPKDNDLLLAAGIFSDWVDKKTGEIISTFAIVTTEPDEFIKGVGHDRSPVFLDPNAGQEWIGKFKDGKAAYSFLEEAATRPPLLFEIDRKLKSAK